MIPLFVSNPESMAKVRVITVKEQLERTVKTLHKAGILHIEISEELEEVDRTALEKERYTVSDLLTRVDDVLVHIKTREQVHFGDNVKLIYTRPFRELEDEVVPICTKLSNQYQRIAQQDKTTKHLTELKTYLEPFAQQANLKLTDLNFSGDHLFSRLISFPSEAYEDLPVEFSNHLLQSVTKTVGNETVIYALGRTEDIETIESLVAQYKGKVIQIPDEKLILTEFLQTTETRIQELQQELTTLNHEFQSQVKENLEKLVLLKAALVAESERIFVLEKASEAKYISLIEGWVPEREVESLTADLKYEVDSIYIDSKTPEPSDDPPIKQKNPRGLKPFQVITNLFGTPKYKEWDPTPIIAFSFAIFFGIMLADVVYALGALLLAKYLLPKFVDDPESDNFKLFQWILYICGTVALVMGVLTGTYLGDITSEVFGIESNLAIVPSLGDVFTDPVDFIIMALAIGVIHVNLGHILGLIVGIKERNIATIICRIGLFILQLSAIPYLMHSMFDVDIPLLNDQAYSILIYLLLLSIVMLVVASIIEKGKFLGSIFWLFDLTGILGDVMSYARLAGVGLATYYLASAFNLMSGIFAEDIIPGGAWAILGTIVAILILVLGHGVNLVLSVMTGFVHSLRLCFVEFLFKFYEGGGRLYEPFKLKTGGSLIIVPKS